MHALPFMQELLYASFFFYHTLMPPTPDAPSSWSAFFDPIYWGTMPYVLAVVNNLVDHFYELLLAVLGTFVGAGAAFALEKRDRRRAELNERAAQGNLALLTLWQMWEVLNQYKKSVIDTAPEDRGRWLNMNVTPPEQQHEFKFDPQKLYFLFEGSNASVLPDLVLEQRRFYSLVILINRRSKLMLEEIWPRLTNAGIEMSRQVYTEQHIENVVGAGYLQEAKLLATELVQQTTQNVDSFRQTFGTLRAALKQQLPDHKFIEVDFEPNKKADALPEGGSPGSDQRNALIRRNKPSI